MKTTIFFRKLCVKHLTWLNFFVGTENWAIFLAIPNLKAKHFPTYVYISVCRSFHQQQNIQYCEIVLCFLVRPSTNVFGRLFYLTDSLLRYCFFKRLRAKENNRLTDVIEKPLLFRQIVEEKSRCCYVIYVIDYVVMLSACKYTCRGYFYPQPLFTVKYLFKRLKYY